MTILPPLDQPADRQLLEQFIDSKSDEAFGRLVARHGAFVRGIAYRRVRGDHHLAEDVTQAVLIVLARRTKHAARSASLRGWLHATTCFAASNALRAASRRGRYEANADRMIEPALADDPAALAASADEWAAIDAALCELRATDRDALMLHYGDGQTLPQVAVALGTTAEGAKKRVQRARERLRAIVQRRGAPASTIDRLAGLATIPLMPDVHALAGGVNGRAFLIAKKVVTAMKLQTLKLAAAIAFAAALAAGGVAVVVAQPARKFETSVTPAVVTAMAAPLQATLADDVNVELIGICSASDPAHWWRADGTPLDQPPAAGAGAFMGKVVPPKKRDFEDFRVAFKVTHVRPNDQLGMQLEVVPYSAHGGMTEGTMTYNLPATTQPASPTVQPTTVAATPIETIYMVQVNAAEYATNCDFRFSIAPTTQPWETLETIGVDGNVIGENWANRLWEADQTRDGGTDREGAYISWATPVERDSVASVEVFDDFANRVRGVVAIDKAGKEHNAAPPKMKVTVATLPSTTATVTQTQLARQESISVSGIRHYSTRAEFPDLRLADVDHFEFRVRSRPALQFSEVALAPNVQVDARVGIADPPRIVKGVGYVSTPADNGKPGQPRTMSFDGERLDEAVARIAEANGLNIYVHWEFFVDLQRGGPEVRVRPVTVSYASAEIALRAVFAAATFDDIAVVVSDDGKTIRVLSGARMLRSDGRVWQPGKIR